jgi:hypothetical protein
MFIMLHHVYNASSVCLKYDTKFRLLIKICICWTYTDFRKLKAVIPNMEYNHKQNSVATTRLHDAISQKALIFLCILPVLLETFTGRQARRDNMFLTFSPHCPIWAFLAAWATQVCVAKMSGVPFEPNNHIHWFSFAVYLTTLPVA